MKFEKLSRRDLLKTIGAGALAVAFAQLSLSRIPEVSAKITPPSSPDSGYFKFVATHPLPSGPFPPHATLVLQGFMSPDSPGVITQTVVPGYPPTPGAKAYPNLTTIARVRKIQSGLTLDIEGKIIQVSNPSGPEGPFNVSVDKDAKTVLLNLRGARFTLNLTDFSSVPG